MNVQSQKQFRASRPKAKAARAPKPGKTPEAKSRATSKQLRDAQPKTRVTGPPKAGKVSKAKVAAAAKPEKMSRKEYEEKLQELQVELCYLQDWVRETGARIVIACEGRDTARAV